MTSCVSPREDSPREDVWEEDRPSRPLGSRAQEPAQGQALKVALIREELVALTNDPFMAVILNQLLYWTQRVKDFDLLLEEEREINNDCNVAPRHGWIYKTAEDLAEETMLRVSRFTIRRYLNFLIEKGWVDEKINSHNKWDKTTQYRVNLKKLQGDLFALGYSLPGFSVGEDFLKTRHHEASKTAETSNVQNAPSNVQNDPSSVQDAPSNVKNCSLIYLNRDYSENINRDHTQCAREISEYMIEFWKRHVGQEVLHLTPDRKRQLKALLGRCFKNDLQEWENFCERIKASPFLMGQGLNKWHVTFDWILLENNALKVLEGNFDSPESLQNKQTEMFQASSAQTRKQILKSIKDPIWGEWCEQLSESNPISLFELEELSEAKFMEFDGRLVWIKSADQKTLNRIESVRFELLSIVQRQFPKARNIRTQLEEGDNEEAFASDFSEGSTIDPRLRKGKPLCARTHKTTKPTLSFVLPSFHSPLKTDLSSHTGSLQG
ncbi:MAG: hypothetical protein BGO67_12420 [Alphaproteobacteria bacterium 41-28]|nr:MAG: hypothetical protein BGO67_12420 [Alphaproteobacteria bacterium 41-28]